MRTQTSAQARGRGFTLIELLIVIGLLGALATLVLASLQGTRTESLDESLVEKELADIQRAFQRFVLDCAPTREDYARVARYGLAPLMAYDGYLQTGETWSFDAWDDARGRGWRGPYIVREGTANVDVDVTAVGSGSVDIPTSLGQVEDASGTEIPVVQTPYVDDEDAWRGGEYYRVVPEFDTSDGTVVQLWVVFPSRSGAFPPAGFDRTYATGVDEDDMAASFAHRRRLMTGA